MRVPLTSASQVVRLRSLEEISEAYLAISPVAHAMFRTVELARVCQMPLERPVLDVGCGTGQFARVALESPMDVGLDLNERRLARARSTNRYLRLEHGDAGRMPFGDGAFHTVLSISVLEHLRDPASAVAEAHRVLQPGGMFVATVVLRDIEEELLYPRVFRRLGLSVLGRLYVAIHNAVFRHVSLLSQGQWEGLLVDAGFQVLEAERIVPARTIRWWDLLLVTAWPYRLADAVGWRIVWRPRWMRRLLRRMFWGLLSDGHESGSCLFIVAQKKDAEDPSIAQCDLTIEPAAAKASGSLAVEESAAS